METLRHIVLFIHLIGFAVLFGTWAVQAFGGKRQATGSAGSGSANFGLMNAGLVIAFVAGIALAAPWGLPAGASLNYVKLGTKLVILLIIGALLGIGSARQKRGEALPPVLFWGIGVLTAANAAIAAIW